MRRLLIALIVLVSMEPLFAGKRVLFVTHTAGYRHDSIAASIQAMQEVAARTGTLEITPTEDLSQLNAGNLAEYDAIFFFTSGELDLSDLQKQDILEFVKSGKGFGGAHSASDTLYSWPEYGEMLGGYFDGHPWAQQVAIRVEDRAFPGLGELAPSFEIVDEIYQHRAFTRENVRVLLALDTASVDLNAAGVNRTDGDFALAWCRNFGLGRVFYTALGHFDGTWTDPRFQKMIEGALLWITQQQDADVTPLPKP